MGRDNDIKAPDGYTLGGLRKVRLDGTILFGRGYWGPVSFKDWIGEKVWVHEEWKQTNDGGDYVGEHVVLEVANPGLHIYEARSMKPPHTVFLEASGRTDAAPVYSLAHRKAWAARNLPPKDTPDGE